MNNKNDNNDNDSKFVQRNDSIDLAGCHFIKRRFFAC